ncbi:nitroreductase family protein [Geobacter pelophilus]|uniref:Nitroreductase family protein n=1 Tax=Geoanaerobacter pelophilus TaxID=60036 RepID=A0AAW4LB85_9BACT|nr:nitroreductase family protein [Geoanaerobacter pelophilus]MBT0664451.1 nitroreductase family protein [Geoanaerobacter pelophilus]
MIELLRKRRSIRKFSSEKIPHDAIELLLEAALRAPSSRGINPWEFVLVDDPQVIAHLAKAKQHGSEFLKNAPLAIVVCADSSKSDVWVEDCSIAAIIIQLTAQSLGLGSCWAQIRNRQHDSGDKTAETYVQELLGLPEQVKVECILGIGHPAEKKLPVSANKLQRDKIRNNHWTL